MQFEQRDTMQENKRHELVVSNVHMEACHAHAAITEKEIKSL